MDDLISRQAVLSYIDRIMHQGTGKQKSFEFIRKYVEKMPSAQPEPHYCRECKWSRCHINVDKHGKSETYWWCLNWDGGTDEEGYCHEWKRRKSCF